MVCVGEFTVLHGEFFWAESLNISSGYNNFMSSFENIRSLGSFRSARDDVIERKKVGKILEAGRNAPSPGSVQSLEFIVVEDDHTLEDLSQVVGDHRVAEAPVSILVLSDRDRMERKVGGWTERFCFAEGSIAVQNMRLTAEELGISSVWKSGFDEEAVSGQLKVPEEKLPVALVSFAYSDDSIGSEPSFGLNQVAFYDEYGHQVGSFFDSVEWKGLEVEKRIYSKKSKGFLMKLRRWLDKVL